MTQQSLPFAGGSVSCPLSCFAFARRNGTVMDTGCYLATGAEKKLHGSSAKAFLAHVAEGLDAGYRHEILNAKVRLGHQGSIESADGHVEVLYRAPSSSTLPTTTKITTGRRTR
ncbi:hypothetical protein [Histidinibacterium aquaticum]|uniref:hypothetical protein n=1 Tax=Histidinibacterium aquaticum TaxID=2613962 RepID=UPI00168A7764|nr:hypothetical protein [Histidinibacterium aquaticum]